MIAFQHNEPAALYSYDPQSHEGSCILEDAYVYNIGDIICLWWFMMVYIYIT